MRFYAEMTDTFGGEANYSWVKRVELDLPEDVSERTLVRRMKAKLGMTGVPCTRETMAETIVLRLVGVPVVIFIDIFPGA